MADWDLFAVVRGCSSAANSSTPAAKTGEPETNPLACLASLTFEEEDDPFSFPILAKPIVNDSSELQDSCKRFLPNLCPYSSGPGTVPSSSISVTVESNSPQPQQQAQRQQEEQKPLSVPNIRPSLTPTCPPSFVFGGFRNQQPPQHLQEPGQLQQQQMETQEVSRRGVRAAFQLRPMQSSAPSRSRKRKNQQKRTICHVTAENLSSDMWAWRKYGQKPIKGSPYPRNYYRCSSSKGCAARKQVERSNTDPNIFIVTYAGEHTHPRPTHRNSLAGSTRNKVSATQKSGGNESARENTVNASCSSPLSTTSLSPRTPLPVPTEEETIKENNSHEDRQIDADDKESEEIMADEEEEEDDLLIPNLAINDDDIFSGFQGVLGTRNSGSADASDGGFGHTSAFGGNFSSWGFGSSATAGAGSSGA